MQKPLITCRAIPRGPPTLSPIFARGIGIRRQRPRKAPHAERGQFAGRICHLTYRAVSRSPPTVSPVGSLFIKKSPAVGSGARSGWHIWPKRGSGRLASYSRVGCRSIGIRRQRPKKTPPVRRGKCCVDLSSVRMTMPPWSISILLAMPIAPRRQPQPSEPAQPTPVGAAPRSAGAPCRPASSGRTRLAESGKNLGHQAASGVIVVSNRPSRTAART